MMSPKFLVAAALLLSASVPAAAQVKVSGSFTAAQACPAYQSFRRQTNPGSVSVVPGQTYRLTAQNADPAEFYFIQVDGAQPRQRWVQASCGTTDATATSGGSTSIPGTPTTGPASPRGGVKATHVLSLSWEPQFCETHPSKAECSSETAQSPDATQLSLHGLWPEPNGNFYCGVARADVNADKQDKWDALPEPALTDATRQHLASVMPGTQSGLERHEWTKHGTCFGTSADAYFDRAAGLVDQVNATAVRQAFAGSIGRTLTGTAIRAAFDQAFGPGAGARVLVSCSRGPRPEITEIVVSLAGDVTGNSPIADLIAAAAPVSPGCPGGTIATAR